MKRLLLLLMLGACAVPQTPVGTEPFFAPGRALTLPAWPARS